MTRTFSVKASITYTYDISALNKLRELILIKLQEYINKHNLPYIISLEEENIIERIKINASNNNRNIDCGFVYVFVTDEKPRIFHKCFMITTDAKAQLINIIQEILDKNPHVYSEWQKTSINVKKLITDSFRKSFSKNKRFDLKYAVIE